MCPECTNLLQFCQIFPGGTPPLLGRPSASHSWSYHCKSRCDAPGTASETEISRPVTATHVCVDQTALSAPRAQLRPTTSQLATRVSARVKSEAVPGPVAGQLAQESSLASYLTCCQAQVNTTTQSYTQIAASSQDVASMITSTNPTVTSTRLGTASMSYRYSTSVPGQLPLRGVISTGLWFTQHSLSVAKQQHSYHTGIHMQLVLCTEHNTFNDPLNSQQYKQHEFNSHQCGSHKLNNQQFNQHKLNSHQCGSHKLNNQQYNQHKLNNHQRG